ncbi:MAG: response regulator, partial [Gammaproteobacteria bacterium]|nr:response regulator [Gammaproteobacteria bacterium]
MTRAKVLIIDDDDSIRWVLEKAVTKADIDAICVENAEKVEEIVLSEQPDAIISDIRMPGTDGLTMMTSLQES